MRKPLLIVSVWAAAAAAMSAQTPADLAPSILRLTVDDAVKMARDHNVDLAAERIDPQIGDTRVAAAAGAFLPSFSSSVQRNNQLAPPTGFLVPDATRTDVITSNVGVSQKLPRFGTSYNVSWNAAHTDSNSFLNNYNPILQAGLSLNVSQPLFRDLAIDSARQQLSASRVDRDIADTRLRESIVRT